MNLAVHLVRHSTRLLASIVVHTVDLMKAQPQLQTESAKCSPCDITSIPDFDFL